MPCFHPKTAYKRFDSEQGKYLISFGNHGSVEGAEPISIPCGKCIGCQRDRAKQWAVRCAAEYETTPDKAACWFVTLTYDDDHLPFGMCTQYDTFTGEVLEEAAVPSLRKKDLQDWFKRLRWYYNEIHGIRYLACGEYGGQTARPHYHVILFNVHIDDLVPYKSKDSSALYFTSASMDKVWMHGQVLIARYDFHTADYVAKYLVKGDSSEDHPDFVDGREKPFLLMSRRPGLGRAYYDSHKDTISETDKIYTAFGSKRPPAYFDRLDRESRPFDLFRRKKGRSALVRASDMQVLANTDKPVTDRLKDAEESLIKHKRKRKL